MEKYFFATDRAALLGILAAGIIEKTRAKPELHGGDETGAGGPCLWKNRIPEQYLDDSSDGMFPVILEIDAAFRDEAERAGAIAAESEHAILLDCPVPLAAVKRFVFRNHAELEDFVLRMFPDVIYDEKMFSADEKVPVADMPTISPDIPDDRRHVRASWGEAEAVAGALLVMRRLLERPGIGTLRAAAWFVNGLAKRPAGKGIETLPAELCLYDTRARSKEKADIFLLNNAIRLLNRMNASDGFDPVEFLEKVTEGADGLGRESAEEIEKWSAYVRDILDAERSLPKLGDTRSIVMKGLLFFIMRPQIERILKGKQSIHAPGERVLLVAGVLASVFRGYRSLDAEFKKDYTFFTSLIKKLWEFMYGENRNGEEWCSLELEPSGALHCKASMKFGGLDTGCWPMEPDSTMASIYYMAKESGFAMEYDFEKEELHCTVLLDDERKQKVSIVQGAMSGGQKTVRFVSPCMNLSTKTAMRKLTKARLLDLLRRNERSDLHCRFALSDSRKAVVVLVDQIVETMDRTELEMHINEVARIADEYEHTQEKTDIF